MKYNKYIDHTCLKADATPQDIVKLCEEAIEYDFKTVVVNPCYIPLAKELLKDSDVLVCTVVGFPLGSNLTRSKLEETELALKLGAKEIDMVINVGMLKSHEDDYVKEEIKLIKNVVGKLTLKVIIETCLLTDEEIIRVSKICKEAGADYVKTSTGFSTAGANEHVVSLIRQTVGEDMGVKASGGIKTHEDMLKMIKAGATRIGTSNGTKII